MLLAGCTTTPSTPPPNGTGSPALNASVTLSVVACEAKGLCVAAGSNPTTSTAAAAVEVSRGGSGAWSAVATPAITGTTFDAASCWGAGCLLAGNDPSGVVVLLVNPANKVSSPTASHPAGSGMTALSCVGPGRCLGLVSTTVDTAVFETSDSGQSWHQISSLPTQLSSGTALSCPTAAVCVAVGTSPHGAAVARSTDGGRHWVLGARPGGLQVLTSVACGPTLHCYATARITTGADELLRSTNGGASWVNAPTGVAMPDAVACSSAVTCLVGGGSSVGEISTVQPPPKGETPLTLAFVPDPVVGIACATSSRCAAVTPASTVSFVA